MEILRTHEINILSDLLQHIHYEFLEDVVDAQGQGVTVHALAEVTHPHQLDQLPGRQAVVLHVQVQLVICKLLLTPLAPHGLHQLSQEVLDLRRGQRRRQDLKLANALPAENAA